MNTILTIEEAKTLGRPIGKVADAKISAFIFEIEQTIIRQRLGDSLYLDIIEYMSQEEHQENNTIDVLLNGGRYVDSKQRTRMIAGLKVAEAYFVYAQYVRAGDLESTRYGIVKKDDEYSQQITPKERDMAANSATEIAEAYLNEAINYCFDTEHLKPTDSGVGMHTTSGCIIRKIRS